MTQQKQPADTVAGKEPRTGGRDDVTNVSHLNVTQQILVTPRDRQSARQPAAGDSA